MSVLLLSLCDLPSFTSGRNLRVTATWDGAKVVDSKVETFTFDPLLPFDRLPEGSTQEQLDALPALNAEAAERLRRRLDETRPSLVVLTDLFHLPFLPADLDARLLIDLHNVESDLARQIASSYGFFKHRRRAQELARARAFEALEAAALERADLITVCSEADRRRFIERFGAAAERKIHVLPNVIPRAVEPTAGRDGRAAGRPLELIYAGLYAYRPNAVAAEFLLRRIMPRLRRRGVPANLTLIGRKPRRFMRWQGRLRRDVRVTGAVEATDPYFHAADAMVVPLFQGGGTRLKIIEAALFGVPVVATRLAAEGLGFEEGREILYAETAEEFAEALARLQRDGALAAALAGAARQRALSDFSAAANRARWQTLIPPAWLRGGAAA